MGYIALGVIVVLILFTSIFGSFFDSVYGLLRNIFWMVSVGGILFLLWKILAQLEKLTSEINRIDNLLSEESAVRPPVCKSCGKILTGFVNYCPDCGTNQRAPSE